MNSTRGSAFGPNGKVCPSQYLHGFYEMQQQFSESNQAPKGFNIPSWSLRFFCILNLQSRCWWSTCHPFRYKSWALEGEDVRTNVFCKRVTHWGFFQRNFPYFVPKILESNIFYAGGARADWQRCRCQFNWLERWDLGFLAVPQPWLRHMHSLAAYSKAINRPCQFPCDTIRVHKVQQCT